MKRTLVAALAGLFVVVSGAGPAAAAVGDWYKGDGHMSIAYGLAYIENDEGNETGHRMMFVKDALDWLSLEAGYMDHAGDQGLYAALLPGAQLSELVSVHALLGWQVGEEDNSLWGGGFAVRSSSPLWMRIDYIDAGGDEGVWLNLLFDVDAWLD